jgi:hypothetical protein
MEIRPAVRRFFCTAPGCKRKTFAEQVQGLTARYARRPMRGYGEASCPSTALIRRESSAAF